ncbi:MAG: phage NrS-1 polymerase family protein [Dehalococcoidia bacterium]
MSFPPALAAMGRYRQFVPYILRPRTGQPGKTDKVPIHWQHKTPCDCHAPGNWTDYEVAWACNDDHRVGFVFTAQDPFFFLDIDNCLVDGSWSPLAVKLCNQFAGAAVEISQSGTGLHIFGTGTLPPHACKNALYGIELYHTGRFAALGGMPGTYGDAAHDCSQALAVLVAEYFPLAAETAEPNTYAWTTEPVPEWRGPIDDVDLIRRMRQAQSAAAAFGSKATPDQLWTAHTPALAQAYPSATGDSYDASSADAALATHLAFWSGRNCERIRRLMLQSGLLRAKWEREDYLQRTITTACALQTRVCQDKPVDTTPGIRAVVNEETLLGVNEQLEMFSGMRYIADINRIQVAGGNQYHKETFDSMYGGYIFKLDAESAKITNSAWECFTKSRLIRFEKVESCSFRPDMPEGAIWIDGLTRVCNAYYTIPTPCQPGDPRPFLEHVAKVLPEPRDQQILLAYMAAIVQHKGVKFQWCILLQGTRGNGKTFFSRCLIEAVGRQHCHSPRASEITEKFNGWQENKIFAAVEDIYVPREKSEVLEILKPLITSEWQEIRGMHKDKVTRHICCNFLLNSNHRDAIRHTADNRSLCIFYTAQQEVGDIHRDGLDGDYFPRLWRWCKSGGYAIINHFLQNYQIPPEFNPAGACHRAPSTSTTAQAITYSLGNVEQEILDAANAGLVGFRDGWVSSTYLKKLIHDLGPHRAVSAQKRKDMLKDLGYIPHPTLQRGQACKVVFPDACKPVIYCRKDHPCITLLNGSHVCEAYQTAQQSGLALSGE